jgi:AcrR family transcriptional regulator
MARIVKDYDDRFMEFLDAAQSLFFSKGYEQTSVQDIINAIGVAKGTFYHYYNSKVDLLNAVVKRIRERVLSAVLPIVEDPTLDATTKFERFFREINNWKLHNHNVILQMLRMLYRDENVLLRIKMTEETRQKAASPLTAIIEQGLVEGVFNVQFPYETAEFILRICEVPSNSLVSALLSGRYDAHSREAMQREIQVFNRCVEHVLGVSENTFNLISAKDLSDWLSVMEEAAVAEAS